MVLSMIRFTVDFTLLLFLCFIVRSKNASFLLHVTDLQLDVKGCDDVYASFDKYVTVEHLDGDNKYHAEQHGLQVLMLTLNWI